MCVCVCVSLLDVGDKEDIPYKMYIYDGRGRLCALFMIHRSSITIKSEYRLISCLAFTFCCCCLFFSYRRKRKAYCRCGLAAIANLFTVASNL